MIFKEHDVVKLSVDDYEIIVTPPEEVDDKFESLPKGTRGTIVSEPIEKQGGCYVEFPSVLEKYPDADCVVWVLFDQMELDSPPAVS